MATEIVMPRLSDSMEEGTVLQWFVSEGDAVAQGEPLVEVETDKASVTYESEVDGTVLAIAAEAGESVGVGAVIAVVGAAGEKVPAGPIAAAGSAAEARAAEAPAPATPVGRGSSPADQSSPAAPVVPAEPNPPAGDRSLQSSGRIKASPLARRIADELDIDLATLVGTGPQGRVVRADVERAAAAGRATGNGEIAIAPAAGRESAAPVAPQDQSSRRPLTRMQQTIARRMAQSRATVPDFELRAEVDMTALVALRERLRSATDALPSYNDFIVKAAGLALREFPRVNASYRDGELEEHPRVNVGVAVAGADALVVPTIFDADRKSVRQIAADSRDLIAKVRDGSITPAELAGGTFSVSNLGMYGVDSFSAVVNAPQAAILAVGSLRLRPVAVPDGSIVARNTVHLSLACDHRVLYGADGARFLRALCELLEQPLRLLL